MTTRRFEEIGHVTLSIEELGDLSSKRTFQNSERGMSIAPTQERSEEYTNLEDFHPNQKNICSPIELNGTNYCPMKICPRGNRGSRLYLTKFNGSYQICNITNLQQNQPSL